MAKKLEDSTLMEWFTYVDGPLDVDPSIDFVDSPWARTRVMSLTQLVGPQLQNQGGTTY